MDEVIYRLFKAFPGGTINSAGEFIAHRKANEWFRIYDCKNIEDVSVKVLSWLSRGAYKTEPFQSKKKNNEFHEFMLGGINEFLRTSFTYKDMERIYTRLGNMVNETLCREFIQSGYDMEILN